jgi:Fuc2NAc and GlcNAc transferase
MEGFSLDFWAISLVFTLVLGLTILLLYIYRKFTIKSNLFLAVPVSRSSHSILTPTGAGFIVALIYVLVTISFFSLFDLPLTENIKFFYAGIFFSSLYGFFDDLKDRGVLTKLFIQKILAILLLFTFWDFINSLFFSEATLLKILTLFLIYFLIIWFSNAINFMDGIDGMLASGSVLIFLSSSILMIIVGNHSTNILLILILIPILLGFLFFNLSKFKLFLGDSGSLFLAFFISFFVLETLSQNELTLWAWLILLSYFLTETTFTTIIRIIITKDWYKPHKSHAYQNLARVLDSHMKITLSAVFFHIVWLLPLAYFAVILPNLGLILFIVASIPVLIFTLIYGPLYSKD